MKIQFKHFISSWDIEDHSPDALISHKKLMTNLLVKDVLKEAEKNILITEKLLPNGGVMLTAELNVEKPYMEEQI